MGWAFENTGLERTAIRAGARNVAVQRVAERGGFLHEDTLRTVVPATGHEYDGVLQLLLRAQVSL